MIDNVSMPSPAFRPVFVMDGNQRSALAATRSLGRKGVDVWVGAPEDVAIAGVSRYAKRYVQYPSPADSPQAFADWLEQFCRQHPGLILYPMTEITVDLCLRFSSRWEGAILPFAPLATVDSLANKVELMQLARKVGVSVPDFRVVNPGEQLHQSEVQLFPVVLKPYKSRILLEDRWLSTAVRIPRDWAECETAISSEEFTDYPYMLQKYVEGEGQGVFAIYDHGSPVAFFSHRRIREKPPSGGVSVLSESQSVPDSLLKPAKALLDAVGWHGVAMVEFKVTPAGEPVLMEINTRFWGSLQLGIDAGVDFPWLLYQVAVGIRPDQPNLQPGVRLRWLLGDLDRLYLQFKLRGRIGTWAFLKDLVSFLIPDPFRTRHEIFRWDDLGPAIFELKNYVGVFRGR